MEVLRYGYHIPFLCDPPLSRVPISLSSYHPLSTKGVALGEVTQALIAKSAVELAPLPSLGFYSRLFVVWKTRHRSLDPQSFRGPAWRPSSLSSCLFVRATGWPPSISRKPTCRFLSIRTLVASFGLWHRAECTSSLLFALASPQVFSRVMAPVSAIPHSWGIRMRRYLDDWLVQSSSRESLLHDLLVVLDLCCELGIVVNHEKSHLESSQVVQYLGVVIRHQVFQGFSIAGSRWQATVNGWRISVLRRSSSQYLALASRHALLPLPSSSGRSPSCEILPALSPQVLGLRGSVGQDLLVSGLPQGSSVVAPPSSSVFRGVSGASLSRSRLLVRRLRRGLGSSLRFTHRFRPLESRSKLSLYKRPRASSHPRGSPPLPVFSGGEECVIVLRQQHSSVVSPQGRGHQVSIPQLFDSGDSALGQIPLNPPVTPVHPRVSKCTGGLSLSPSPAPTYQVVPSSGGFSVYKSYVASPNRLICNIRQSPMFSLFSLPSVIRWLRAPTHSSRVGTGFRPTPFLRGLSFHECWRNSGCLRGRSSP